MLRRKREAEVLRGLGWFTGGAQAPYGWPLCERRTDPLDHIGNARLRPTSGGPLVKRMAVAGKGVPTIHKPYPLRSEAAAAMCGI